MPRKRLRQKKRTVVPPVVPRFRREDMLPAYVREFEPFSYTVNGVPQTMSQEDFDALATRMPAVCMVCTQQDRDFILAYCPSAPQAWGAEAGKDRMIWYTMCLSCHDFPDWRDRVTKMLAGWLEVPGYDKPHREERTDGIR